MNKYIFDHICQFITDKEDIINLLDVFEKWHPIILRRIDELGLYINNVSLIEIIVKTRPHIVYAMLKHPSLLSWKFKMYIPHFASEVGNLGLIKAVYETYGKFECCVAECVLKASERGYVEIVKYLLKFGDITRCNVLNKCLPAAIEAGNNDVVHVLINDERIDPTLNTYARVDEALASDIMFNKRTFHLVGSYYTHQLEPEMMEVI